MPTESKPIVLFVKFVKFVFVVVVVVVVVDVDVDVVVDVVVVNKSSGKTDSLWAQVTAQFESRHLDLLKRVYVLFPIVSISGKSQFQMLGKAQAITKRFLRFLEK